MKFLAKRVTGEVLLHRIQIRHQVRHLLRIVEPRPWHLRLPHTAEHLRAMLPQRRDDCDFRVSPPLSRQRWRAMLPARVASGATLGGEYLFSARRVPLGIHKLPHPKITEQLA